jgi:hypothetical protein
MPLTPTLPPGMGPATGSRVLHETHPPPPVPNPTSSSQSYPPHSPSMMDNERPLPPLPTQLGCESAESPPPTQQHTNGPDQCSCAYRHRDWMGRIWIGPEDDRYLSSHDGRLAELVVQTAGELCNRPTDTTWKRTTIQNATPLMLRIVCWTMSSISMYPDQTGRGGRISDESSVSLNASQKAGRGQSRLGEDDWGRVCVKWLPASFALFVLVGSNLFEAVATFSFGSCLICCRCSFPQT